MAKPESVEIRTVTPIAGSDYANIDVAPKGNVTAKGDITLVTGANGAVVTIKLNDSVQGHYKLNYPTAGELGNHPICVYSISAGEKTCNPGVFPNTRKWSYEGAGPKKVTLNVPPFPIGEKYEYMLFVTETKTGDQLIIDPQIGCCVAPQVKSFDVLALLAVAVAAALLGYGVRFFQERRNLH